MYEQYNAKPVLAEVEKLIAEYEARKERIENTAYYWSKPRMTGYPMDDVYERLSIFDWWVNTLSYSNLLKMRGFLREAIKLGFTGYVCFKVGASGCANGMWAHKEESTTGYSPDGDCLYRSFTPDYTCYSFFRSGEWFPSRDNWGSIKTPAQLEKAFFGF